MKTKISFFLLLFFGIFGKAAAQDKMLDRKGNEFLVKVLEITPDSIVYKPFADSAKAITYVVSKAEIFMITYQNNTKEIFPETKTAEAKKSDLSANQLYYKGKKDALAYYKGRGAYWATFGSTLYFPPAGLVVGAAVGLTPPSHRNFIAPEPNLLSDPNYLKGYAEQAKKRKLGKAAAGFGTALAVYTVFIALILSAVAR